MFCPNDGSTLRKDAAGGVFQCPLCPFNVAPNTKILETMYAWVSVDAEGREGFMAVDLGSGVPMPMIHSERAMVERLRGNAKRAVKGMPGYRARLIKFSHREILDD